MAPCAEIPGFFAQYSSWSFSLDFQCLGSPFPSLSRVLRGFLLSWAVDFFLRFFFFPSDRNQFQPFPPNSPLWSMNFNSARISSLPMYPHPTSVAPVLFLASPSSSACNPLSLQRAPMPVPFSPPLSPGHPLLQPLLELYLDPVFFPSGFVSLLFGLVTSGVSPPLPTRSFPPFVKIFFSPVLFLSALFSPDPISLFFFLPLLRIFSSFAR